MNKWYLLSLFIFLVGCGTSTPEEVPLLEEVPLTLAIFEREQWDTDVLPAELQSDIDLATVRLIEKRNNRHYWMARDDSGDVCLIVGFGVGRPDWDSGRGCKNTADFRQNGITVSVSGSNHFSSAVLVPDGYTQNLVETFPGQFIATNLVAFNSTAAMNSVVGDKTTVILSSDLGDLPDMELQLIR